MGGDIPRIAGDPFQTWWNRRRRRCLSRLGSCRRLPARQATGQSAPGDLHSEISDLVRPLRLDRARLSVRVYTADYFARRGAWAGLRSGAGRHAGSHDPAMQQRHHEVLRPQVSPGHVDQSFNYWTRRMPAPCSRIVIHCAKTDCPTRSRPATTPRDVRATPKSNIFGRRSRHIWTAQQNAARWLFFASHPKQPRPPKGAPSAALSSVKTPGSGDANGRVGLNSRTPLGPRNYER